MNILLESEGGHMSTFGMQSTQVPGFFLVFLSTCLTREWGSALCRALLSGIFLGDLLPCHSFHNHLATPSSGDTFLPSSRLLFPAATYCQFISDAKLKPTSSALLFQWLAITLRIRATPSSNRRFYLTWFYSSLTSPTSALQYSPGGQLVISRPMSPFFCL